MVDMNEKDIIGAFQRIAEHKPGEDSAGRDLQKVRDMLTSQHARIAPERESIWRIIMKSKWTKMTSAAPPFRLLRIGVATFPASFMYLAAWAILSGDAVSVPAYSPALFLCGR